MSNEVLQDTEVNIIVDCDVLEASKENIQPLAGGRRVTTLASVLATPHVHRDARLAQTKKRLRDSVDIALETELSELEDREDDDRDADDDEGEEDEPLAAYVHLVNWTVEHYPRGHSAESGILELLEEATRVLLHRFTTSSATDQPELTSYQHHRLVSLKSDPRYLKLWLMYAGYVDRPDIIFEYLLANDIGSGWGVLYEEYGVVLERGGRKQRADEIYLLGIARNAEPLEHLKNRHRDFQKRMMTSTLGSPLSSITNDSTTLNTSHSSSGTSRAVLGAIASSSSTSSTAGASNQRRPLGANEDVFNASSSQTLPSSSSSRNNGRRLDVFSDDADDSTEPTRPTGNAWPTLPTRSERVKENVRKTEKMGGTVLKGTSKDAKRVAESRKRDAEKKTGGKLEVFCDDEEEDITPPVLKKAATKAPSTKAKVGEKKTFALFEDNDEDDGKGKSSSKATKASTSSGMSGKKAASFMPFEDGEETKLTTRTAIVPSTPAAKKFELFEDEELSATPIQASSALAGAPHPPDSVMKLKPVLGGASSEAEALRRDPFKNYSKS